MEEFKQPQPSEYALTSIAISLKRIADKLELSQKQPIVMSAEEWEKANIAEAQNLGYTIFNKS